MKDIEHVVEVIVEIPYSVLVVSKAAFPETEKYMEFE